MSHSPRNALIAGGVVLLHLAALWAFQTGLLQRVVEVVVPVEVIGAMVTPPQPAPEPPAPSPRKPVEPAMPHPVPRKTVPVPPPAPRPVAQPDPTPAAPTAPVAVSEPQPAPPPISTPVAAAPAPAPAPAAAPKVEQPITNADYLQNPTPVYPRASIRLGEEGTTVVRVLIGPDGRAQQARTARSSGSVRLDKAAEETTLAWRYVPGKRGGVPEPMWVDVPIKWELKKD